VTNMDKNLEAAPPITLIGAPYGAVAPAAGNFADAVRLHLEVAGVQANPVLPFTVRRGCYGPWPV